MISNPGQVLDATTTNHDHGVFLQVMTLAADVSRYFVTVRQANTGHLSQSGIGFFGGGGIDARANPPFLRATLQSRYIRLADRSLARLPDQLVYSRHNLLFFK